MNKRQTQIVEQLRRKGSWITGKELAVIVSVSDRTIRNDIDHINSIYPGLVVSNMRYGYCLDEKIYLDNMPGYDNAIPQTADERKRYILNELLVKKSQINILDLEETIFISESTLKHDLRNIGETLGEYGDLKLKKSGNYISVEGSEENKRALYRKLLADETKGNFVNLDKIAELFPRFDLIKIKNYLEKVMDENDYVIRKESLPLLMIHIGVAIERIVNHNFNDIERKAEIQSTVEYKIASIFYGKIASYLNMEPNESEIALLASLLLGRRSKDFMPSESNVEKADRLTDEIIDAVNRQYDIDFSGDNFFQSGLQLHIQNLLERIDKGVVASNVYINDIKRNYPLVFDMSVFVGKIIEKRLDVKIHEDELGYMAIHIGAAYDRLNVKQYYHAVLIQPNSRMLSMATCKKINDKFSNRLVIDEVEDYYEECMVDRLQLDLILTTVSLNIKSDIPVVNISMFVNSNDEYRISRAINELDNAKNRKMFYKHINQLVNDESYFYNLEADNYEEAIRIMSNKLYECGRVNENFYYSTLEREKMAFTSFNYGFATPHPLDYSTLKSTIGIAVLKKPILWGKHDVKLVLLLAIREDEKDILRIFFDWFSDVSDDEALFGRIIEAENAKRFIELIKEEDK